MFPTRVSDGPPSWLILHRLLATIVAIVVAVGVLGATATVAGAQISTPPITTPPTPVTPIPGNGMPQPGGPTEGGVGNNGIQITPSSAGDDDGTDLLRITVGDATGAPSQSLLLIVGLGVLSLAPSIVIMLSSFTRIVIVLSLTRNALGLQGVPPNQVITGLALFLSLFVMGPTLSRVNENALQPYLDGQISQSEAMDEATGPVREFMLAQGPTDELAMILNARGVEQPESPEDISMSSLIPAFMLSELRSAFIIGMVIFIPFVLIDLIVAATLMSLGMMMLPPVFVSLPLKLILFVMVGGWSLIVETLLSSFRL